MSTADTEKKLIRVICDHFLDGADEKLTVAALSKAAGISRQAFHKNYLHLKPYLSGHKKVDELLLNSGVEASKIVLQSNALVRRLQSELELSLIHI